MKSKTNIPTKYIIQLSNDSKSNIIKTEKDLSIKFTSSSELSSTVRAQDILDSGNGLFLKNLGIAIVEDYELEKLRRATSVSSNPIVYWEKDREFKPVVELDIISEIKSNITDLAGKIEKLESLIRANNKLDVQEKLTWGLNAIGMGLSSYSGKGVDICVLDTGLYVDHPDFSNRNITGKSFISGENWNLDIHGHGTHCTGIAAGKSSQIDNKRYGVAFNANIAVGKVLADSGSGSTSAIIDAIDNSIGKGYDIISMSLGSPVRIGEKPSPIFEQVGRKSLENNCLIIAAAGNNSHRPNLPKPVSSPANTESIMAVAALDQELKIAKFSNGGINASNGGRVDIAAPGVDIYSSYSKNNTQKKLYKTMSGTSMATPYVAGIAALYREAFPNLSAQEIWLKIEKGAKQLSNHLNRDIGHGIAQAI